MAICHYPKRRHDCMAGAQYRCLDRALGSLSIYSFKFGPFVSGGVYDSDHFDESKPAVCDRPRRGHDYDVNLKAELEIELLHQKLDLLREEEIGRLIQIIERLEARLSNNPTGTKRK